MIPPPPLPAPSGQYRVTQLEPVSQDLAFRILITPDALCFAHVGELFSEEDLGSSYEHIDPLSPAFIDADARNFRLPTGDVQIVIERRPHLHNPLNSGSMHFWLARPGVINPSTPRFAFLLDYTTNVDQLIDALRPLYPSLEVHEDPALQISTAPAGTGEIGLHISLQWQRGMGMLLLAFALGWTLLIASLGFAQVSLALDGPSGGSPVLAVVILVVMGIFLLAGLFLVYYAATHLVNTTRSIRVRAGCRSNLLAGF